MCIMMETMRAYIYKYQRKHIGELVDKNKTI